MDLFSVDTILEILQAVHLALLIAKLSLEIRQNYKRWRMERRQK